MTEKAAPVQHGQIRKHPDGRLLLVGEWGSRTRNDQMHYFCVMPVVRYGGMSRSIKRHPSRDVLFRIPRNWAKSTKRRITEAGRSNLEKMEVIYRPPTGPYEFEPGDLVGYRREWIRNTGQVATNDWTIHNPGELISRSKSGICTVVWTPPHGPQIRRPVLDKNLVAWNRRHLEPV